MGVKDSFMGAPMLAKIAFGLVLAANFFSWIAFTTTGWAQTDLSSHTVRQAMARSVRDVGLSNLLSNNELKKFINNNDNDNNNNDNGDDDSVGTSFGGPDIRYGIWRSCRQVGLSDCSSLDGAGRDWIGAFQAFSIFGFVGVNACFALVICFIFMDKCKGDKEASIAACICGIVGAVCWLFSIIIFGAKYQDDQLTDLDLGYSFGLAVVAFLLSAGVGVAMALTSRGYGAVKPSGEADPQTNRRP